MPELAHLPMRVVAVERSPGARRALEAIEGVTVREAMPPPGAPAVIVAHELLDNLPFRRLRATDDGPREVHVGLEGDRFVEVLAPVDDLEAPAACGARRRVGRADRRGGLRDRGARGAPGREPCSRSTTAPTTGRAGPPTGTRAHRVVEDLLAAPGATDITAGVDFGFLARAAPADGTAGVPDRVAARRARCARARGLAAHPARAPAGRAQHRTRRRCRAHLGRSQPRGDARRPRRARTLPVVRGHHPRRRRARVAHRRARSGVQAPRPEPAQSPPRRTRSIARYCSHTIDAVSTNMQTVAAEA